MTPIQLKQVVDCMGATVRNDQVQPTSDPPLTLQPESSRWRGVCFTTLGARSSPRWEVISLWRQGQSFGDSEAFNREPTTLASWSGGFVRSDTADQPTLTCVRLGAVRPGPFGVRIRLQ